MPSFAATTVEHASRHEQHRGRTQRARALIESEEVAEKWVSYVLSPLQA